MTERASDLPNAERSSLSLRWAGLAHDDDGSVAPARLARFVRILLFVIAIDQWHGLGFWSARPGYGLHAGLALGVSLCAALAWRPGSLRRVAGAAAVLLAIDLVWAFPDHANHQYLACLSAVFVALFDPESPEEAATAVTGLRWLVTIGLVWAGIQKVLWGYYFDGTFLSFAIAERETFASTFQWILSDAELERLVSLPLREGAGPYRAQSAWLDAVSVVTWVAEIGLAVGLWIRPFRSWAAVGAMALIAVIEVAAREFFFGLIMFDFLLLFFPDRIGRLAQPAFFGAGLILLASVLGWLPDWTFT